MDRKFDINDRVICNESGVIGKVLRFYTPTSCDEQTMVLTDDSRKYHAPTSTWIKYGKGQAAIPIVNVEACSVDFVKPNDTNTADGNVVIYHGGMRAVGKTFTYGNIVDELLIRKNNRMESGI